MRIGVTGSIENKKFWLKLLATLFIIFILVGAAGYFVTVTRPDGRLKVNFLDVGQGDAILIQTPAGQNILVDGGPDKTILRRLAKTLPWWDRTIDLAINTHPHEDHLTGLLELASRYRLLRAVSASVYSRQAAITAWAADLKAANVPLVLAGQNQTIDLGGGIRLEIISPSATTSPAFWQNNASLTLRLVFGQTELLLSGDNEAAAEAEIIRSGADLSADILKIGHHGSDNATSESWLESIKPRYAVISVGRDNRFGHPSQRILKKLERAGISVYRTDQAGTIIARSDGSVWQFTTQK